MLLAAACSRLVPGLGKIENERNRNSTTTTITTSAGYMYRNTAPQDDEVVTIGEDDEDGRLIGVTHGHLVH